MTEFFNKSSMKKTRRRLRQNMPKAEIILWSKLEGRQLLGFKFRRQYSVGPYVVDFFCPAVKLAVELDGDSHYKKGARVYDSQRQAFIESFGIQFLRFLNSDVYENLDSVWEVIACEATKRREELGGGEGGMLLGG